MDLQVFARSMSHPAPFELRKPPDDTALRTRRSRAHKAGDHSLCLHGRCDRVGRADTGTGWPTDHALRLAAAARARWDRSQPRPVVACWICGKPMPDRPRGDGHRPTCSPCTVRYGAGVCAECGGPKRLAGPGICRACRPVRPKAVPGICKLCEEPYVPKPMARPDQRWCSKSCAQAWRNGARPPYTRPPQMRVTGIEDYAARERTRKLAQSRARRLRHAQTWDGITDEEILDRDGWRCQITGCKRRPIRKDLKYPHLRSKSIDHIVPLSLGGDDTAVNKRAAHLGCNMSRGNQMEAEQLPLFGSIREPPLATMTAGERAVMFQRKRYLCACGAETERKKLCCQECHERRQEEIEKRRALRKSCPVHYYTCRYCKQLKVAKSTGQQREVCPERPCQLARLAANNLRIRNGLTAEDANTQVAALVRAGTYQPGRWARCG